MEVNPAIALAAVFLGAAIWGPIGAIIGVPIAAVVVSIMETYGRRYELVPHLTSVDHQGGCAGSWPRTTADIARRVRMTRPIERVAEPAPR